MSIDLSPAPTQRLAYLDSIRGIAAVAVLASHCWQAANGRVLLGVVSAPHTLASALPWILAKCCEAGRSSVMIFFVLSGFVLASSLIGTQAGYAKFAIKRIFRIYPAFLVVIVLSWLLHEIIGVRTSEQDETSIFVTKLIHPDLSIPVLLQHLLMLGTEPSIRLDGVTWSLVHELRMSLIFPFILWSVQKYRLRGLAAYGVLSLACTLVMFHFTGKLATGYEETTFTQTVMVTGYFIIFFAVGAYLAVERQMIAQRIGALATPPKVVFLLIATLCFLKADRGAEVLSSCPADYLRGGAAFGLIALMLGTEVFRRALGHGVFAWLGRVSYSLYLVHVPIIYIVMQTIGEEEPIIATVAVVIPTLLAAELLARMVELPFISLGKRVASAL